ncbi:MAG: tRNA pseudouridine(38-40) synthase TruA [Firmicutes bacterium]|nr:tRNA pseudouridine(38-40) synthase TruA [Bacillota bacterium]
MRNIKLTLQYDGTNYHGWQTQENAVTVQEVVEKAIAAVIGARPKLVGCGRTDSGVHAMRYVCNFKSETHIPERKLPLALNAHLPADIVCMAAEDVSADFDARYSAKKKCYKYYIQNSQFPNVFRLNRIWHYPHPLDIEKMRHAAEAFLGEHDFIGFAARGFTVKTTVRTIYSIDISKKDDIIEISVCGNGFLYNMVRIIAGTLVFVGGGKLNPDDMSDIIASCDRKRAGMTAPAAGLYLSEVYY